jgi:hypothetical protein
LKWQNGVKLAHYALSPGAKPWNSRAEIAKRRDYARSGRDANNGAKRLIDLYYWPTPNGHKVTILLEECGIPYTIKPVNIGRGDQLSPSFLKSSPNGRMPAIVDHEPLGGGAPRLPSLSRVPS